MEISISDELNSIINFSREEAMRTGSYGIAPDHLFLGILRHRENTAVDALRGTMVEIDEMKQFIDEKIFTNEHIPYSDIDKVSFSRGAQNVLSFTILEATKLRSAQASSQHLLLALCIILRAYVRCDGKSRRYGNTDKVHLGEVGTLAAEQLSHLAITLCLLIAEGIDTFYICHNRVFFIVIS